jgi:uncharacterized membrane protein
MTHARKTPSFDQFLAIAMRSRRAVAARLQRTARSRKVTGTILIILGIVLWVAATLSLIRFEPSLGVISSGVLVAGGVVLIAT